MNSVEEKIYANRFLTDIRDKTDLRIGWSRESDTRHGHARWIITATAKNGEKWVSAHVDYLKAARGLVKLLLREG